MKNALRSSYALAGLVAGVMASGQLGGTARAQSSDALIDTLVKKGVLTEQEAEDVKSDLHQEHKEKTAKDIRVFWKDGLNFESGDGKTFKGKFGGRVDLDMSIYDQSRSLEQDIGKEENNVDFRRVRLSTEGIVNTSNPTFYKVELDFVEEQANLKDVYMGVAELPLVGTVQAGHFKEPVSLELLTSSRYTTFMERATPVEAFAPERNTGAMLSNTLLQERMTWAFGAFTDVGDSGSDDIDGDYAFSARVTGVPIYDEETKGRTLVHLGLSGRWTEPSDDTIRFRSRPEARTDNRFADTGNFAADEAYLVGAEAAGVLGPLSLQGEFFNTWVDGENTENDPTFYGFYVYGSWFLTGEHRPYKLSSGVFDRVKPKKSFGVADGGLGAWELTARYSHLDLNDAGFEGGILRDITGGVTWYLNSNLKMLFNYVYADLEDRGTTEGHMHSFLSRLHVDF